VAIEKSEEGVLVNDLNSNGVIDPGDTVRFGVTYRNSGTVVLTGIKVVADYDQTFVVGIANLAPGGQDDKDKITWDLGTLAPGDNLSISYEATLKNSILPQGPVTVANKVEITSDQTEPVSTLQSANVKVPNLKISKNKELIGDLNADGRPGPGDTLKYTLKIQNTGDVEAVNILIEDDYDQSLLNLPLSIPSGGVNNRDMISWHFDRVGSKADISIAYDDSPEKRCVPRATFRAARGYLYQSRMSPASTPCFDSTRAPVNRPYLAT
jgi:uncharacterized repeat protein (TIGR01451 family)